MSLRPSVILIRESEDASIGCCRIPRSALASTNEDPATADRRAIIDRMGTIYDALRQRFGRSIDLQVVDPRTIALPVALLRDFFVYRVGVGAGLRTLARIPTHGVIVNGRIVDDADVLGAVAIVSSAAESRPAHP